MAAGNTTRVTDPHREALARLGGRYEVRVLEPSPPAVAEPPFFADDPAGRGDVPAGRSLVSPVTTGDVLWDDLTAGDEELTGWCAERWLGGWRRLGPAPPALASTRAALHRVAEHVLAPARQAVNGKIGLRFTRGGFGTPFFGADRQLRVDGDELVVVAAGVSRSTPIATLADAGGQAGLGAAALGALGADAGAPLDVDRAAAGFLGDWFGFAASVLEQLRAESGPERDPSRTQLWPEHFDLSVELGAEAAGQRAGYGCSPGDDAYAEPYCYVTLWTARPDPGELWNADGFPGAVLPFADLLAAEDQRAAALAFFRERLAALGA